MSLEYAILETVRALPAKEQEEVLNHAAWLRDEARRKTLVGHPGDVRTDLSTSPAVDKSEIEMWRSFFREDV